MKMDHTPYNYNPIFQPYLTVRSKCFEKAMRRSFFSRDNMENFIKFCRSLGVHENLLFESDDLGKALKADISIFAF